MKRLAFVLHSFVSFVFSFALATNLFAYLLHYPDILGGPHFGRWYEPFHLLIWYFTVRVPGNTYRIAFIAFLAVFSALAFIGFRIYTKLNANVLGIYGKSRWLKTGEMRKLGAFVGKGVILGQTKDARFHARQVKGQKQYSMRSQGRLLFDNSDTHVLIVAPTRAGKGISCVCPTLLSWTYSAVIYDLKKENFEVTSGWRRIFSYVLRFEPTSSDSVHFNPLWEIEKGPLAVSQAQNVAEILVDPDGDGKIGDHWRATAKQLLLGAILYVLYSEDEKDKSLAGVFHLLNSPNLSRQAVLQLMSDCTHPAVQESARNMLNKADEELSGVFSTASQFLSLYQDPIVAANTAYSDFNIKDLTTNDHPVSLYLCINPKDADRLRPLTRLILDLIAKKLTSNLHSNKHRLLFLIDEFPSLGRLSFFEQDLAFFAGYKIKAMLIAQSFNQLYAVYGERTSILDNCKRKAILGSDSPQDAKVVSEYLGTYSVNRKTVSQTGTLGNIIARSRSTSYMETERKLMNVEEILRLPYEDFILITGGEYPYLGRKIMYYLDKRFAARVNLPTLHTFSDQIKEIPSRTLCLEWVTQDELTAKKRRLTDLERIAGIQLPPDSTRKQLASPEAVLPAVAGMIPEGNQKTFVPPQPAAAQVQSAEKQSAQDTDEELAKYTC